MKEKKNPWGDELPAPAKVVPYIVALLVVIVAVGLAGQSTNTTQDEGINTTEQTTSGDQTQTVKTTIGTLGSDKPVVLPDGSAITTLVESPDLGLLEVGVTIKGPRAGQVALDDIYLLSTDGKQFWATELNTVDDSLVFTINAELTEGNQITLIWTERGTTLVELS